MRLIDADALCLGKFQSCGMSYQEGWNDALDAAATQAPTVDAVILPCPLGTTLYRVCEERLNRKPFIRVVQFNRNNFTRIVLDGEIGKTAFLTREEAEVALAKMT